MDDETGPCPLCGASTSVEWSWVQIHRPDGSTLIVTNVRMPEIDNGWAWKDVRSVDPKDGTE